MTLSDYCKHLGWSAADLARNAAINEKTARKALNGESVSHKVAQDIAKAISYYMGTRVQVGEIEGLNVS